MAKNLWRRTAREIRHQLRAEWSFSDVAEHWDHTDDYDDFNSQTYSYSRRFSDALRMCDIPREARALDLCARTGNGTLYFHRTGRIASAVCADVSSRMGEICRRRLSQNGVQNFVWVQIHDYALPFADVEFDAVLCFETVEHFSQPERLVMELGRVTRAGGTLVLTTPNMLWEPVHALAAIAALHHSEGPHRFIRYGRLRRMVRAAGFKIERAETTVLIPAGPEFLVRMGEWLEERTKGFFMRWMGLRHVLICRKVGD